MNKKGVTLMELVIVMAIIAIGAVLMAPNIGAWLPHYRLKSATRDIASAMRLAQMKAVSTNAQYQVSFNEGDNSFVLRRETGGLGLFVDDGARQFLPSGVTLAASFAGDNAVFNSNSTASGGNVVVTNSRGKQSKIDLLSTTGRVRIE